VLVLDATPAERAPSAGLQLRLHIGRRTLEGKKAQGGQAIGRRQRRTMVRTPSRSKALKARFHVGRGWSGRTGNGSIGKHEGRCETNARRATAVVTPYGCGWEESFEG